MTQTLLWALVGMALYLVMVFVLTWDRVAVMFNAVLFGMMGGLCWWVS